MSEGRKVIDHLIISSPFEVPTQHWEQDERTKTFELREGRRPAGYYITDPRYGTNRFERLELVNRIRTRVDEWRAAEYPGVTAVTRKLLEHWRDRSEGVREHPFYFCQIEAIETLIWWVEAPDSYKQGIEVAGDGGAWERLCSKMATGSGKTMVMGMIVAWQVINAVTYADRQDLARRYSRAIFVVTPGLTVRERLQVLYPSHEKNVYDEFGILPSAAMREQLSQAAILVENWHSLMPLKVPEKSVLKKGAESDEAFTRRVLGDLTQFKGIVVLNDEAHHAYRVPPELKGKKVAGLSKEEQEEATRWIEGLDRIHKTRRILRCFDLSATPFAPTGKKTTEEALFPWIMSDFGLNDAIESGLVKTPRVVIRDDSLPVKWKQNEYRARLYHIYNDPDVKDDFNRKAEPHEPLPELVQIAYTLLGTDWLETRKLWQANGHAIPPTLLTVCNRVETAARIEHFFGHDDCLVAELNDRVRTLRVDSRVLEKAEVGEKAETNKDYEERLREIVKAAELSQAKADELAALPKEELLRELVDTVGKAGKAGQRLQNVVSVAMLSEGWDAKNVTQIMGLRAFTSQLLCEQVIGRGLRRTAHEMDEQGRFLPEYVNVFGVPFNFLPQEGNGEPPPPPKPRIVVESLPERREFEIVWPNVLRVDQVVKSVLTADWGKVPVLKLHPELTPTAAQMAPVLGGVEDWSKVTGLDLKGIAERFRLQHLVFHASRKTFEQLATKGWKGEKHHVGGELAV